MIKHLIAHPKKLLFVDCFGAFISTAILGHIMPHFEDVFGMPRQVLYFLSIFPFLFIFYDILSIWLSKNYRKSIAIIAVANSLFCLISISCLVMNAPTLTPLGWTYFILELILVGTLAGIEFRAAKRVNN